MGLFCDGATLSAPRRTVTVILPIKDLNSFGAQIDWRKCSDDSSNQNFEYFRCPNWLEEMYAAILRSRMWIFFVAQSIGGNVLMIPPIKNLNICGAQIDWRKCFEKSSDQKFQYCWCRNWLEEMFQEILRSKISTLFVAKSIGGNVLMILPIQNLNIVGAEIDWMKCFKKSSDPKFEHFSS